MSNQPPIKIPRPVKDFFRAREVDVVSLEEAYQVAVCLFTENPKETRAALREFIEECLERKDRARLCLHLPPDGIPYLTQDGYFSA